MLQQKLERPLAQSMLPILTKETGKMHGVVCIPNQLFEGDRLVQVSPGKFLPATVVTRAIEIQKSVGARPNHQFMAIQYPQSEEHKRPWLGLSMFIPTDKLGAVGEWYNWIFKTGIAYDIGIGAKNIRSGVWSNRNKAWDTTNQNDKNNPALNPNNRPNIGNGTEDWGTTLNPGSGKVEGVVAVDGATQLRWDFNVDRTRLTKCSYFDCYWLDVFYESLAYYNLAKETPTKIDLKEKDTEDLKIGFMYEVAEPAQATLPSCIRFLCTTPPKQAKEYLVTLQITGVTNTYIIQVHCHIV